MTEAIDPPTPRERTRRRKAERPAPKLARRHLGDRAPSGAIIVSGGPWAPLAKILTILQGAGLADPEKSSRADISTWHGNLFGTVGEPARQIRPDQPQQLLAAEILLENGIKPSWGWADSRSLWTLDFWSELDSGIRFVLVSVAPARLLAMLDAQCSTPQATAAALVEWQRCHQEILRFKNRCPERVLVVQADDVFRSKKSIIERLLGCLGLDSSVSLFDPDALAQGNDDLLDWICAEQLRQEHVPICELWEKLSELSLMASTCPVASPWNRVMHAKASLRRLLMDRRRLEASEVERDRFATESLDLREQVARLTEALYSRQQELETVQARMLASNDERQITGSAIMELRERSGSLASQLQRAQLEHEEQRQQLAASQRRCADLEECLQRQRGEHAAAMELQQASVRELAEARALIVGLDNEKAELMRQVQQAQAQCNLASQAVASAEQQAKFTHSRLESAEKELLRLEEQLREATAASGNATNARHDAQEQVSVVPAPNDREDLLLRQLHRVQEKMEGLFLQCREMEVRERTMQDRLARASERWPDPEIRCGPIVPTGLDASHYTQIPASLANLTP